jgi:hypothetical protein
LPPTVFTVLKSSDATRVVHTLLSESWFVHTPWNCWYCCSNVGTWSARFTYWYEMPPAVSPGVAVQVPKRGFAVSSVPSGLRSYATAT